jgi:hypothetical protein
MAAIKAVFNAGEDEESRAEIKNRCTLSCSVVDRMYWLVIKGKMPLCKCPHCMNGKVTATRVGKNKYALTCLKCSTAYRSKHCDSTWVRKVCRALLFKYAVDDVVYVGYCTEADGIKVDEVRFSDNDPRNCKSNLTDINFTIFIKNT